MSDVIPPVYPVLGPISGAGVLGVPEDHGPDPLGGGAPDVALPGLLLALAHALRVVQDLRMDAPRGYAPWEMVRGAEAVVARLKALLPVERQCSGNAYNEGGKTCLRCGQDREHHPI